MANNDAPFGLKPIRHKSGAPYNGAARPMIVLSAYDTALFIGDPVIKVAGGSNTAEVTVQGGGVFPPGTLPNVEVGAAGGPWSGVIVAVGANPDSESTIFSPADTEGVVWVADDPDLIFEVQEVSGGTALTAADVGLNASIVAGSGSTATGQSAFELDNTTEAVTAGLELKIVALSNKTGNAIGEHAVWEVQINDHTQANATAGI